MATPAANKRLTREYKTITASPPPYITAHPSETNILEWHYLLTGPPDTPYAGGQYWGTLHFPPDYPFKPPAIRMTTPSGRFQTNTRLCLSISDFHPKSFNPAWEVSTILIGLLSFMTSEEMTTGSVSCSADERRRLAGSSRWWNSTNGGKRVGSDGGRRFREEWGEVDAANWSWMEERRIDPQTGCVRLETSGEGGGRDGAMRKRAVVRSAGGREQEVGQVVLAGESWIRRNRIWVGALVVVGWVLLARALE